MEGGRKRGRQEKPSPNEEDSLRDIQQREGRRSSSSRSGWCSCRRFLVFALGLCLFVWAYPSPIDPISYKYSDDPLPKFEGPLAINDLLKKGEKKFENEFFGPEAFAADHEGRIYTGVGDGRIIRIDKNLQSYEVVLRTGENLDMCNANDISAVLEEKCGRPLGLVILHNSPNEMYVSDSAIGLLKVNIQRKKREVLIDANNPPIPLNFLNDLVELPNGTVLVTDSSLKFSRHDNILDVIESRPNGQLLAYEPVDGSVKVVLKDLFFPNGICLHHDGESVLLAETSRARILRFYFTGSKEGEVEMFSENLVSWPDNISPSPSGGYWVGSSLVRSTLTDLMSQMPSFRSFVAKFHLTHALRQIFQRHGIVLKLDKDGRTVKALHDKDGYVTTATSHVLEKEDGGLVIGSYLAPFIVYLKP